MTKERPTAAKIDFSDLIETTIQIMTLRGGPTSGNWAHGGRKGKRGGSGKGGGFKRIGVKGGKKGAKKLGRKGIKRSSRQTRVKDERGKGKKDKGSSMKVMKVGEASDKIKKFIKSADTLSDTQFGSQSKKLAKQLSVKDKAIIDLMDVMDNSPSLFKRSLHVAQFDKAETDERKRLLDKGLDPDVDVNDLKRRLGILTV